MRRRHICTLLLFTLLGTTGCGALRPLLVWRDPLIVGRAQLADGEGAPLSEGPTTAIVVNFINREGKIEDSLLSVEAGTSGRYSSPVLTPGEYTVEAMTAGFSIESQTVVVRNHEHRRVDFVLKKIREQTSRSLREADEDNIPHPGEVQIRPPPF